MTDGPGLSTFTACVVADDDHLLLLRRAFSHRVEPGAWTTSLRGDLTPGEQPVQAARRQALRLLGLRLEDVRTVPATHPAGDVPAPAGDPGACTLVARVRRRVVVPDPTHFDEAQWVDWDGLVVSVRTGALPVPDWSAAQVERLAALGSPSGTWAGAPTGDRPAR